MEEHACIGRQAPVVVLARAVDAVEGLLMEKGAEAVLACHLLQKRHEEHVMVDGEVHLLVDWSQFKLVWCYLVVTCLAGYSQLEGLHLKVFHECLHTVGDDSEVVVIHLLVLRRVVSHEGPAGEHQVGTRQVEAFVHEEILLFPTQVGDDLLNIRVEVACHGGGSLVNGMQSSLQRSLVVERLAGVGYEDRGDTQCVVDDEDWRCGIPCRIATSLEGGADATVREGAGIRFLLYKELS